jgi:hypothetical protein
VKLSCNDKKGEDKRYKPKGATPGYVTQVIENSVNFDDKVSKNQMFESDHFALNKTFSNAMWLLKDHIIPY